MLTNKLVVLTHNYPLEASFVVVSLGTCGLGTWIFIVGQASSWASQTFWFIIYARIRENDKVFPKRRVEDFDLFREWSYSNVHWFVSFQDMPIVIPFSGDSFLLSSVWSLNTWNEAW